jgi:hypothetical protein
MEPMRQAIERSWTFRRAWDPFVAMAGIALLAACQPGPFAARTTPETTPTTAASTSGSVEIDARDVEAPEVFRTEAPALWDGRPSLGGTWVAAPDVQDPERVVMRNPETGASVIGALFRRERANPGPPLQLSSEAAAALGILAGMPTVIEVVALRRDAVEEAPETEALPPNGALPAPEGEGPTTAPPADDTASAPAPYPTPT